jgi:transposase InsO family protein
MSADVCGLLDESFTRYRYFGVFKDHYSKLRFICFLLYKSDVVEALKDMLVKVKNDGHVIKELLSDNGGEFDNEEVRSVLHANGITQRLTAPYVPQQNGVVERYNRTIVEMARTLKYSNPDGECPGGMWAELC